MQQRKNVLTWQEQLARGGVIPAHPLALKADKSMDVRRQKALTRYYMESGVQGLAVGVHTTQFAIRDPKKYLLRSVLQLAAECIDEEQTDDTFIKIAGAVGDTDQAVKETELAASLGYHAVLLSNGGLQDWSDEELLHRTKRVGEVLPVIGFYLQPRVGGRELSYRFWRQFADIPSVVAIKIAPFDRYQSLDVVRAVCESDRWQDIALYTGNDDNIVMDLLSRFRFVVRGEERVKTIVGGLLGHWAVWTRAAVQMYQQLKSWQQSGTIPEEAFQLAAQVSDMNAALFDPQNEFRGCIPGIHEVLRRQGLLEGTWCLDENEKLSPGQQDEIDRVVTAYPHLIDDDFIQNNINRWLR